MNVTIELKINYHQGERYWHDKAKVTKLFDVTLPEMAISAIDLATIAEAMTMEARQEYAKPEPEPTEETE